MSIYKSGTLRLSEVKAAENIEHYTNTESQ